MAERVAVLGAGAWGTAIAWTLADNGHDVSLWAFESDVVDQVNEKHVNETYLPDVDLPQNLTATSDMKESIKGAKAIFFVTPAQFMRPVMRSLGEIIDEETIVVSATKGIENETLAFPNDVANEYLPKKVSDRFCCLSGPTFAKEIVKRVPTAATISSVDDSAALTVQEILSNRYFRLYLHHDVVGVEIGGAVKNVIAIAAGVSDGLGFGQNTRAAIITRGLSEMVRLGHAMGADEKTFSGLAGIGDLVLTCAGDLSRNRTVGLRLGKGETIDEIKASMKAVAEGVATSLSIKHLADREKVDLPIINQVYRIIYEGADPKEAVTELMGRTLKPEFDG